MVINDDDFWKCPTCRLQAMANGALIILKFRGQGRLGELVATDHVLAFPIYKMDKMESCEYSSLANEDELKEFLSTQVS